jgi:cysteinyl-tRNA synthetase
MKELKTTLSFQQANEIIKVLKLLAVIPEKIEAFDLYLRWKEYNKPSQQILEKFEERNKAKNDKNFALSDSIRKELKDLGWSILDKKEGSILLKD